MPPATTGATVWLGLARGSRATRRSALARGFTSRPTRVTAAAAGALVGTSAGASRGSVRPRVARALCAARVWSPASTSRPTKGIAVLVQLPVSSEKPVTRGGVSLRVRERVFAVPDQAPVSTWRPTRPTADRARAHAPRDKSAKGGSACPPARRGRPGAIGSRARISRATASTAARAGRPAPTSTPPRRSVATAAAWSAARWAMRSAAGREAPAC